MGQVSGGEAYCLLCFALKPLLTPLSREALVERAARRFSALKEIRLSVRGVGSVYRYT